MAEPVDSVVGQGQDGWGRDPISPNLEAVLHQAPFGGIISSTEMDGTISYLNPEFTKITGYELADLPTTADWIHRAYPDPAYRSHVLAHWAEDVAPSNMHRDVVYRVTCKDGAVKNIQFRASALEEGHMFVMLLDVTRRKKAEDALVESEARFRNVVEASPMGIFLYTLEPDGRLVFRVANSAANRILGVDNSQFIGQTIEEAFPPLAETEIPQRYREVALSGVPWETEQVDYQDEQIAGVFEVHAFQTSPLQVAVLFWDITERRQMEERLRHSEKMEAIGQLAGGVAHDFNNQLTGILGCADMLRSALKDNQDLYGLANMIVEAAERSARLTSQLLAFARKGKFRHVPVDLHQTVKEVTSLLRHSIDKNIHIRRELQADFSATTGDPAQLQSAVLNLALNARDAMPAGGELLFATRDQELDASFCAGLSVPIEPGRYVELSVTDTGIGMDVEVQKHLFEPFFTTKEQGRGTGMGLAAVYGTVNNHQGAIRCESQPGEGTKFLLYFPVAEEDEEAETHSTADAIPRLQPRRVLLVDDEEVVCHAAQGILEQAGYQVSVARDGLESVEMFERDHRGIDLVVLDMVMPRMGGSEVFSILTRIHPGVRVLLSSGYGMNDQVQRVLDEGALGFVGKPYRRRELLEAIEQVLEAE